MNLVVWSLRKVLTFLSGDVLEPAKVVEIGIEGWKPYMASNGLRFVEADLFEL